MKINLLPEKINLLYIEDNTEIVDMIIKFLKIIKYTTYNIVIKSTIKDAIEYLDTKPKIDAILLDLMLPNSIGLNTFIKIKDHAFGTPIVIISGFEEMACECVRQGAQDYLVKPEISPGLVSRSIKYAIQRVKLENTYKQIINSSCLGYHMYELQNDELIFIDFNPASNKILEYDNKKFLGKTIKEAFPGLNDYVYKAYHSVIKDGIPWKGYDVAYCDSNISLKYFKVIAYRIPNNQLVVTFEDVTEQKKLKEDLKKKSKEYKALIETTGAGIYTLDFKTLYFTYVNHVACNFTGYTKDEFKSLRAEDILTEKSMKRWMDRLARLQSGEFITPTVEYEIKCKDGSIKWVLVSSEFIEDEDENIVSANVVALDITIQKNLKQKLKEKESAVYSVLEQKLHSWKEEMTIKEIKREEQLRLIDDELVSLSTRVENEVI